MEVLESGDQSLFHLDRKLSELSEPVDSEVLLYNTVRSSSPGPWEGMGVWLVFGAEGHHLVPTLPEGGSVMWGEQHQTLGGRGADMGQRIQHPENVSIRNPLPGFMPTEECRPLSLLSITWAALAR